MERQNFECPAGKKMRKGGVFLALAEEELKDAKFLPKFWKLKLRCAAWVAQKNEMVNLMTTSAS